MGVLLVLAVLSLAERTRNTPPTGSLLAERPPPGVLPTAWRDRLDAGASLAAAWGEAAQALGWSAADLYSLHPLAPLTRLDAMGAAFLALSKTVVAVTAEAVVLSVPPHGAVQRARRPTLAAPPAWMKFDHYVRVMGGADA